MDQFKLLSQAFVIGWFMACNVKCCLGISDAAKPWIFGTLPCSSRVTSVTWFIFFLPLSNHSSPRNTRIVIARNRPCMNSRLSRCETVSGPSSGLSEYSISIGGICWVNYLLVICHQLIIQFKLAGFPLLFMASFHSWYSIFAISCHLIWRPK